jgi:polysaccharide export outer membrane protein
VNRTAVLVALVSSCVLATGQEYTIGVADVVHVAVFGQPEMTGDFAVDGDGFINFPFLGKLKAAGASAPAMEASLTSLLADGFLKKPHVAVSIKEFHSQRVFVTGEVQRPGAYGLRPERSLLQLLGDVGELAAGVGHEVIVIRPPRESGAAPAAESKASLLPGEVPGAEILHASLRSVRSGRPGTDLRLEPGDTVYFPKAAQIYVTGNVTRAGAQRYEEGLTVYQALNLAGGVTDRGSAKGVKIVRIVDGKRKELQAKPADLVQPEDTLVVPERFF